MKNFIFILVFSLCFLKLNAQTIKGYTLGAILKNPQDRNEIVGVKSISSQLKTTVGGIPGYLNVWALADGRIFQFEFRTSKNFPNRTQKNIDLNNFIASVSRYYNVSFKMVWDDIDNFYVYKALYKKPGTLVCANFKISTQKNITFSIDDCYLSNLYVKAVKAGFAKEDRRIENSRNRDF